MNSPNTHPGYRLILPYLKQIENLILDPDISEIMVNSPTDIFIEKQGVMEKVPGVTIPIDQLRVAVQNIARSLGDDISEEKPILDSRLPDGSRIAAVLPPCSIHGITLTIRKFNTKNFTIADLIHTLFGRIYNRTIYSTLLWDLNKTFRIAFEATYLHTDYKDPIATGRLPNSGFGLQPQFQWTF